MTVLLVVVSLTATVLMARHLYRLDRRADRRPR